MHLAVISPIGFASTLDLDAVGIWRFEMRPQQLPHLATKGLALGVSYVTAGTTGFVVVCAIDCKVMGDELKPVVEVGLPAGERSGDKERVREALKILFNTGMPRAEVEEIIASSAGLVDCYHDIVQALWGFSPPLDTVGPIASGAVQGWRWALLRDRFSPWIKASLGTGMGMGAPPGTISPMSAPAPMDPIGDELAAAANPLGPPPGTAKSKKKPA